MRLSAPFADNRIVYTPGARLAIDVCSAKPLSCSCMRSTARSPMYASTKLVPPGAARDDHRQLILTGRDLIARRDTNPEDR